MMVDAVNLVTEVNIEQINTKSNVANADINSFEQALDRPASYGLGDAIVDKISDVKAGIDSQREELMTRLNESEKLDLKPADLLQAQMEIARIALQEELIAKSVGRTNQNVETLIKTQ